MKHFNRAEVFGKLKSYKTENIKTDNGELIKGTAVIERSYTYKKETKTQLVAVTFLNNQYNDYTWLEGKEGSLIFVVGGVVSREYEGKYYTDFQGREVVIIPSTEKRQEEVPEDLPF